MKPACTCSNEAPVVSLQPEEGLGLIFRQPPGEFLLHDGECLRGGVKYLFRSDVMYRRQEPATAVDAQAEQIDLLAKQQLEQLANFR